jgi:RimJ/RimL family protein N-acetyltransferase
MGKPKLSARERSEKRRCKREFMTIFINGKQKRVRRPQTIEGLPVEEFMRRNADPIWLVQNEEWELLYELEENQLRSSYSVRPLRFADLDETSARAITLWRYGGRYSIYDGSEDEFSALLAPEHRYFAAWHGDELVGYCCLGPDARVPGGNYARGEPEVLDVGGGLRPDLTGRRLGQTLAQQALHFAVELLRPSVLRVTVLGSNVRARALCRRLGFREAHRFRVEDLKSREFVQLERGARGLRNR